MQVDTEAAVLRHLPHPPLSLPQEAVSATLDCSSLPPSLLRQRHSLHGTSVLLSACLGTPFAGSAMTGMQLLGLTYCLLEAIAYLQVHTAAGCAVPTM